MKIDKKLIKELTDYLNELGLTELEYGNNELKIKVSKSTSNLNSIIENKTISLKKSNVEKKVTGNEIKSPIIGTVYLSPEPGAKTFIEIGKKIKKGDIIMIVEAMKTMNHVPATIDGIVKEICVEDGQPVEFGQTIVILN
jgi:acetyl-CoA carboxylase biotin carboxyl carrier protein